MRKVVVSLLFILLAFSSVVVLAFFSSKNLLYYYDPLSVLVTLIPTLFLIQAVFSDKTVWRFIKVISGAPALEDELKELKGLVTFASRTLWIVTLFTVCLGAIAMLQNLSDLRALGLGWALNILSVLYTSLLQLLVLIPCRGALESRLV